MSTHTLAAKKNPLGQPVKYTFQYQPNLLFSIPRAENRKLIGIHDKLPFKGADLWNAFELSWLNKKGKPEVAIGEFILPVESPFLIESKSIKLYFNSFTNTRFNSMAEVEATIKKDFSQQAKADVHVSLKPLTEKINYKANFPGTCLDTLDVACDVYQLEPNLLKFSDDIVHEELYSHLLKSNCPITGQPDWGSVYIEYQGKRIDHESLLKYIVSMRSHAEYHEQCAERIFMDIYSRSQPQKLTVYLRYTRRGGIDINPYRSTHSERPAHNIKLIRQ